MKHEHLTIGIDISRGNTTRRTGVEEYVFQLVRHMVHDDHARAAGVRFILYSREPLIKEWGVMPDHVTVRILSWPPRRLWTHVRLSWEMLVAPPNILFVPGHVVPLVHPKKTVMTVHDVAAATFAESYSSFERWYSLAAARYALKHVWKICTPSAFTKEALRSLVPQETAIAPIFVTPLGVSPAYTDTRDEHAIARVLELYGIRAPFLLSVGRLETKKNSLRIIESFEQIKPEHTDLSLVLVGGEGHGAPACLAAIQRSPYAHDILRPGFVEERDLPYIMQAASALVFSSLYEGFGLPILESFACGTPVVTSNTTACREIAGGAAVLVDPLDSHDIARGIRVALERALVQKGRERVKAFSWQQTSAQTLAILMDQA